MNGIWKLILKITIACIFMIGFMVLVWWAAYKLKFAYTEISNCIFMVSGIVFVISLAINVGAGAIFTPFGYMIRRVFARKKLKEEFASYHEYQEAKKANKIRVWYLTIIALVFLVVALILALIAMK